MKKLLCGVGLVGASAALAGDTPRGAGFFFFQGTPQTVTETLVNPYTGEVVEIDGDYVVNNGTYLGDDMSNDTLFFNNVAEYLALLDGGGSPVLSSIDEVYGADGDDVIILSDSIEEYPRTVVFGGNGNDIIWTNIGDDEVYGSDGDDQIVGGPGGDEIDGGFDNDYINGGAGSDIINGGPGNDMLLGGEGEDRVQGNSGDDELYGQGGNDFLVGLRGANIVNGGEGNDVICVGLGSNIVFGEAGDDVIGGSSIPQGLITKNVLVGGLGSDSYYLTFGATIVELDDGELDYLLLPESWVDIKVLRSGADMVLVPSALSPLDIQESRVSFVLRDQYASAFAGLDEVHFVREDVVICSPNPVFSKPVNIVDLRMATAEEMSPCVADLNCDWHIDAADLAFVLAAWGQSGQTDFDNDNTTSASDLAILLAAWGRCY